MKTHTDHCEAYRAWKSADLAAQDTEAALRIAFIKYVEGIGPAPRPEMIGSAEAARREAHRHVHDLAAASCRCINGRDGHGLTRRRL